MQPRTRQLLLAAALLALGATVRWRHVAEPPRPLSPAMRPWVEREAKRASSPAAAAAVTSAAAAPASRAEATRLVVALYRKELLTRELDLEQQRYRAHCWEATASGVRTRLRQEKAALRATLNAEANALLAERFPSDPGEPIAFESFFDEDRVGPNVAFLSATARARFEADFLANGAEAAVRTLSPDERETYRQWNEPAAAVLREQLAGFNPAENEFRAVLQHANDDETLARELGAGRFAELRRERDPAVDSARRELRRLDAPLAYAAWLVATRTRAVGAIQDIWQNPTLADATKRANVAQLERAFGQAIAAQLNVSGVSLDEIGPAPR